MFEWKNLDIMVLCLTLTRSSLSIPQCGARTAGSAAMDSRASDHEKKDCVEKAVAIVMKHAVSAIEKKNGVPTMEGCVAVFQEHGQKWLDEYLKDSSLVKFSIIGWKLVVKRDMDIASSKQMDDTILQSLKEITAFQPRGATVDDLWAYVEAAYRMPDSVNSLKQVEVQLKCGVDTLKSWNKIWCKGTYLAPSLVASEGGNLGTVDKSVETDVKTLASTVKGVSDTGSKKEQFWQALEKVRGSGFITEEVYEGIKNCAEQRHNPDALVQYKNRIVSLRRSGKILVGQVKVFLRGSQGHFGIRSAIACLLWNEEVLQFLSSIPLTVDEETKTDMHRAAEEEVMVWFKNPRRKEVQAAVTDPAAEDKTKAKYDRQEIREFFNTLSKSRRDGSITEEAYQAIQSFCDKRPAFLWMVKFKKSILPNTKEGTRTLKRLNKFSKSIDSLWPLNLAIAYLLWKEEILQFAEDSELSLDQAAKTVLYQGAERALLDWSVKNLQPE